MTASETSPAEDEQAHWPARAAWLAVSAGTTAVLMVVVYAWQPQFYLVDDKRNQYLPVMMDIGRRLLAGEWLPVIDPNLGNAGNYSLDVQYGLFEPVHWLVAIGLSGFADLQLAAFVWALVFEVLFAVGTTALASRLRMPGAWAAAAGLAAAASGWVFFKLSLDWVPGLMSITWVPWLWWSWTGLGGRLRARDCLGIAVFSYLVFASGWPSTWLAFAALVAGLAAEAFARRDRTAGLHAWLEPLVVRSTCALAGVVSAGLTVLPLSNAASYTIRQVGVTNNDYLTPNLADVLAFAAPQLNGELLQFPSGVFISRPVFFAVWFGVVILWSVRWDRALWQRPAVITSVVGCAAMVVLMQAPSSLGPIRNQIRQLSGAQLFFAVGVCALAHAGPLVVSRARVMGIFATVAVMGGLSWSRNPGGGDAFAGILVVGVAAVVLVVVIAWVPRFAAVMAVASTFGLTLTAFGLYNSGHDPLRLREPDRLTAGTLDLTSRDAPVYFAHQPGGPGVWDVWQRDGVGRGFSDLRAGARVAPGYSSIMQRAFHAQMCLTSAHGQACPRTVDRLFEQEPTTGVPYVDLLGYRTLVVQKGRLRVAFDEVATPDWHLVKQGAGVVEYQRDGPIAVAGRVTDVLGRADLRAVSLSNATQAYQVSTPTGATLVFRDLYWPGYVATLDGRRLPVTPLHGMLVSVELPPGAEGRLVVSYVPLSNASLVVLPGTSLLLLGAGCVWVLVRGRRSRAVGSAGVNGDEQTPEPDHREPLQDPV